VKFVLCLAVLVTSAAWADEPAERSAIEATIAVLNNSPSLPNLFTRDFANADELHRFLGEVAPAIKRFPVEGIAVETQVGTLIISREPMGEATLFTVPPMAVPRASFVIRSVTFISPNAAVVVAVHERQFGLIASGLVPVLLVLRHEGSDWRSLRFECSPKLSQKTSDSGMDRELIASG
jgi:hypothetical protein